MALYIQTNISSMQAQKNLIGNHGKLQKSFNRLSSGFRINTAADDAAGLAISESMKAQVRSYNVAERNAADGISMAQTAEGALGEVHNILGRMRELSMQSSNGNLTQTDRGFLQTEFSSLQAEVSRIRESARFNGVQLVGGSATTVHLQVGLNATASDRIALTVGGVSFSAILAASIGGTTSSSALASLSAIDQAIASVSTSRSKFGAAMNRLDVASSSIQTMRLNLAAANSRIRDVDVAAEAAAMSRHQVLTQIGVSVLAQANQLPLLAYGLIGG